MTSQCQRNPGSLGPVPACKKESPISENLQFASLVLGLGLSGYAAFTIVTTLRQRRRESRAHLADLRLRFGSTVEILIAYPGKATRLQERVAKKQYDGSFPGDLKAFLARTEELLGLKPDWDLAKLGSYLGDAQLDALAAFLDGYNKYTLRLSVRLEEYKAAPERDGALSRLLTVAALDDFEVSKRFADFERTIDRRRAVQAG